MAWWFRVDDTSRFGGFDDRQNAGADGHGQGAPGIGNDGETWILVEVLDAVFFLVGSNPGAIEIPTCRKPRNFCGL
jgi:hypothetical protein